MNYEICFMVYACSCLTLDLYEILQLEAVRRLSAHGEKRSHDVE